MQVTNVRLLLLEVRPRLCNFLLQYDYSRTTLLRVVSPLWVLVPNEKRLSSTREAPFPRTSFRTWNHGSPHGKGTERCVCREKPSLHASGQGNACDVIAMHVMLLQQNWQHQRRHMPHEACASTPQHVRDAFPTFFGLDASSLTCSFPRVSGKTAPPSCTSTSPGRPGRPVK